uniref:Uncharacterized protein n=1 Tax=Physcomitrium patens TaxID=3218 RepID=A0A2K1I9X4_PHYPA|nr:hypothetical protein PHYPA_031155 [Physcomitrium patens]PNR47201.1 hypothetical protein PHYPA_014321 [Physcomitrium patens]PNR47202.1 hypothetical protein PHYPA_014322 [Physcomitrium patens]
MFGMWDAVNQDSIHFRDTTSFHLGGGMADLTKAFYEVTVSPRSFATMQCSPVTERSMTQLLQLGCSCKHCMCAPRVELRESLGRAVLMPEWLSGMTRNHVGSARADLGIATSAKDCRSSRLDVFPPLISIRVWHNGSRRLSDNTEY